MQPRKPSSVYNGKLSSSSSFKGIITASACECELTPHNMQSAVLKQYYFMGLSLYV